ncbi:cytochrome c3 family protein [Photobacterium sanctipauli]|nr:cytochrome c3 family protein [Photobacterium sanctipauli]
MQNTFYCLLTTLLSLILAFATLNSFAEANKQVSSEELVTAFSTQEKFPKSAFKLKPHHKALQLECANCHDNAKEGEYKRLETEDCLQCHKSREAVADRTQFMDVNLTNPHNSLHDRLDLDCYECHAEHKPSQNLCSFCHKTDSWMGQVP